MVRAAAVAPIKASISTPVLWWVSTRHRTRSVRAPSATILTLQCSSGSGWQNGMIEAVFLAAMTPAMIAASNTGPFWVRCPLRRSASATAAGNCTRASASALRWLTALAPTSTMVGWLAASRWLKPWRLDLRAVAKAGSAADVIHFDARCRARAQYQPLLAIAIRPPVPELADHPGQFLVALTGSQRPSQIEPVSGKQAGKQHAIRRQPRPGAIAAERLGHRRDKANFALAIGEGVTLGDFAPVLRREGHQRPARRQQVQQ